jgi:hypothetical protein
MGLVDFEIHVNEVIRPYYLANFQNIEFSVSATPYKHDKIWMDPYYKNMARLPRLNISNIPQHIIQRGNNRLACFFID